MQTVSRRGNNPSGCRQVYFFRDDADGHGDAAASMRTRRRRPFNMAATRLDRAWQRSDDNVVIAR